MQRTTKIERTGSYRAMDELGHVYTIHVFTEFEPELASHPMVWKPVREVHRVASTGALVAVEEDGSVLNLRTGLRMRRRP